MREDDEIIKVKVECQITRVGVNGEGSEATVAITHLTKDWGVKTTVMVVKLGKMPLREVEEKIIEGISRIAGTQSPLPAIDFSEIEPKA